jgi:hypothetical protein
VAALGFLGRSDWSGLKLRLAPTSSTIKMLPGNEKAAEGNCYESIQPATKKSAEAKNEEGETASQAFGMVASILRPQFSAVREEIVRRFNQIGWLIALKKAGVGGSLPPWPA